MLLTGCNSGGGSTPAVPTSAAATAVLPGEREAFGGLLGEADEAGRVLRLAEGKKTAECMKERGFRYTPHEPVETTMPSSARRGDVATARKYGYGLSPRLKQGLDEAANAADPKRGANYAGMDNVQVRAWARALGGPVPGDPDFEEGRVSVEGPDGPKTFNKNGCVAIAQEAVRGDNVAYMQAEMRVESLTGEVWSRMVADPEWAAAQKRWSACMKGRGYSYSKADDASDDIVRRLRESRNTKGADAAKR
ncbi:hypothetical protein, partial [Mobilicoccus pelagius]